MTELGLKRVLTKSYAETLALLPEALQAEGFGVLTEIDVQATLKKKLDVDFRKYKILGACNPPLAHRVLSANLDVGLMLPCNVIVYETDAGQTAVVAVDPLQTAAAQADPQIRAVAESVREKLGRVLARLG